MAIHDQCFYHVSIDYRKPTPFVNLPTLHVRVIDKYGVILLHDLMLFGIIGRVTRMPSLRS
jgi:hypothetical protein